MEAPEELLKKLRRFSDDPALAEFTCPICWEPFWQPVGTVCGHAFCEGCLLKSVLAQLGHQQPDVSCPMCRHPLHVEDVAADEALLVRLRGVIAQRHREEVLSRSSGRLCRGSTRSPKLEAPVLRPEAVAIRAQSSSAATRPVLASWMRVAPRPQTVPELQIRPERPQSSDERPQTSSMWARERATTAWAEGAKTYRGPKRRGFKSSPSRCARLPRPDRRRDKSARGAGGVRDEHPVRTFKY